MKNLKDLHTQTSPCASAGRQVTRFGTFGWTGTSVARTLLGFCCLLFATSAFAQTTWMGMRITVGNTPISINALGRMALAGNSRTHQLKLVKAKDGKDVAGTLVNVSLAGATTGSFKYASLPRTVTLAANTAYYLVSSETQGGDSWYGPNTGINTTNIAVCHGGVFWSGSNWATAGGASNSFVPVSFTYGPRDPENPSGSVNGIDFAYYEPNYFYLPYQWWRYMPDLNTFTPLRRGTKSYFNIAGNSRADNFVFKFTGYIDIPATGTYTFYTFADDGCDFYIGDALIVFNRTVGEKSGQISLKAGKHAFTAIYFETRGNQLFHYIKYAGPGVAKQNIPTSRVFRGGTLPSSLLATSVPASTVSAATGTSQARTAAAEEAKVEGAKAKEAELNDLSEAVSLFPNPAVDVVQVSYEANTAGPAAITINDAASQTKFRQEYSLHEGQNTIELNVSSLPAGTYLLRFSTDGNEAVKKLIIAK